MRGGLFREDDPSEVVEFVDRKLLNRGVGAKVLSRSTEGVRLGTPTGQLGRSERRAARQAWPHVSLYRPRLSHRSPRLFVAPGSRLPVHDVPARLTAAGVTAATRETSSGHWIDLPDEVAPAQAVALGLTCLKALGAPGPSWEWEPIVEVDTSSTD